MARIIGTFWDTENDVPVFSSAVELRDVVGTTLIKTVATDYDGKFIIEDVAPGEYMLVGKSFVHHPAKVMLTEENAVVEPGIEVVLETTPAAI